MHLVTSDNAVFRAQTYDYLVVGGGTAGLTLAARLAQDKDVIVGVLEAGHDHRGEPRIDIPGLFGSLVGDDEYDWQFSTTPQPGLGNRSLPWPRGRVLGGTSALNFVVWNRGAEADYDAWEALGNPGWGWKSLLPFFKKSETLQLPSRQHQAAFHSAADPAFHGTKGPISTSYSPWYAATHPLWRATLATLGLAPNPSALSGSNTGSWTVIQSVDGVAGKRSYAASAYLAEPGDDVGKDATRRPNLFILTGALVHRVRISGDPAGPGIRRAEGVEYSLSGSASSDKPFFLPAKREVVLAAGTVQSPQLLELSGVGDASVLAGAGVPVIYRNANVGRNLQDHLMTSLVFEVPSHVFTPEALDNDPDVKAAAEKLYHDKKDGVYRSSPSSMAYVPLRKLMREDTLSELKQQVSRLSSPSLSSAPTVDGLSSPSSSSAPTVDGPTRQQLDLLSRQLSADNLGHVEFILHHGNSGPFQGQPGRRYVTLHQIQQYPFARGHIHIRSSRVQDHPSIDPNYYAPVVDGGVSPDLEIMAAAVQYAAQIPRQPPLSGLVGRRVFPPEQGPAAPASVDDWRRFVRETTITDWHPIGTCAMLPESAGGVVGPRLQVYGVVGLRVADASIIPLHISSHLQATVYAVAEKAADMIREDRLKHKKNVPRESKI